VNVFLSCKVKFFSLSIFLFLMLFVLSGCSGNQVVGREYSGKNGDSPPFNFSDVSVDVNVQSKPYSSDTIKYQTTITNNSELELSSFYLYASIVDGSMASPAMFNGSIPPGATQKSEGRVKISDTEREYAASDLIFDYATVEFDVTSSKYVLLVLEDSEITWEYFNKQ